jgi:tail tube protein
MTQAKGSNAQLVIDFEDAFGEDNGTPAGFKMPLNTANVVGARNMNAAQTITGGRNPVEPFSGNKSVSGPIVVPLDSIAFWYWMKACFGAPVTTGTGPYVHEFKVPTSQPSLVIEQGYTDITQYQKFNGCKISGFSIQAGGDGEMVVSFDVVGATYAALSATPYDASPTTIALSRLSNFQAAITEGGGAISNANSAAIQMAFNLDTQQYVIGGGGILGDIPEGIVGVGGNLTTLFEDATLLNKAMNTTESSLKLTWTNGASSIVEMEIQELLYAPATPGIPGPQGIQQSLDFQGYHGNGSEASALVVRITNSEAHA